MFRLGYHSLEFTASMVGWGALFQHHLKQVLQSVVKLGLVLDALEAMLTAEGDAADTSYLLSSAQTSHDCLPTPKDIRDYVKINEEVTRQRT